MIRKLIKFFTKKEQRMAIVIFLFMVTGAGLEVFSLGLFALFIGLFIDDGMEIYTLIVENSVIELSVTSKVELIRILALIIGLLFIFKNIFLLSMHYILHKFIYKKYTQISTQLLKKYIEMPYLNHLQTNSAYLQRNVNTEAFWLFANVMVPSITLLTELVMVLAIMLALFYIEPINTMILMCFFGVILFSIMTAIKRKMDVVGVASQSYFGEMVKSVNQSLGSIKLTKVSGTINYFLDNYQSNINYYANNTAFFKNISQWPRYFVETIIIIGVVVVSSMMVRNNSNLISNIPIIGFFGMAAIRLMPSFNRITSAYTTIRYYSASLNIIFDELNNDNSVQSFVNNKQNDKITFNEDIEFKNVSFIYPGAIKHSVENISFKIKKGQSVALIGKSGSGKTTIVDLICGLIKPNNGEILTDGKDILNNYLEWRKLISYVPQDIYLLDDSLRNNIAYGKSPEEIDDDLIEYVTKLSMLDGYIKDLEFGLETSIGENGVKMSGGERQRLGIARALYSQPELLILDEGTAALDNKAQEYVTNSISSIAEKITVITIAHRLDTIKNSDVILLIEDGSVKKEFTKSMLKEFDGDLSKLFD